MRILWIPHTGWHIPQRAHLFCRALAKKHEVHVTDFIADFKYPLALFTSRYWENFFDRQYKDGNITVHGVPRIAPALFSKTFRDYNTQRFSKLVSEIIHNYQIDVVVGTFVVPPPKAPCLIFDLFDDNVSYWRTFGKNTKYADEIELIEKAYLEQADEIVTASGVLAEKVQKKNPLKNTHWIPNGVELAEFETKEGNWRKAYGWNDYHVVGVIGNHDKKNEMERVVEIARRLSNENFKFVIAGRGTALSYAIQMAKHYHLKNIDFISPLHRDKAPGFLKSIDIGLCPYTKTPGAEMGSPMRLLQYSAAGLPVVCTDLAEVRRMNFPNVLLANDTVESFITEIRKAFEIPRGRPPILSNYDLPVLVEQYERLMIR